jgi:hypothetical protein
MHRSMALALVLLCSGATAEARAASLASHRINGTVDRTRPLCPYPQVARYTGTGSIDEAANFVCGSAVR